LQCSLAELMGDVTTSSPEWLMIREMLEQRGEVELGRARVAIGELFGTGGGNAARSARIALIGLRGAGKSTLGEMLSKDLNCAFVELSRDIEQFAGCSVSEIQSLYGMNAYRRYERRALEEAIQIHSEAVIATPGGLVSDPATFNTLLAHCTTVWLQADPEDHMRRVVAQGDMRPMAANPEAMDDLKGILAGRAAFYSKAEFRLNTSDGPLAETFVQLRSMVRQAMGLPER
jgi:XRE family transcriptional regulator, aerobic/anaerobic benzoate catabolism transcriptional regulator